MWSCDFRNIGAEELRLRQCLRDVQPLGQSVDSIHGILVLFAASGFSKMLGQTLVRESRLYQRVNECTLQNT